jgi:hypothetical protein
MRKLVGAKTESNAFVARTTRSKSSTKFVCLAKRKNSSRNGPMHWPASFVLELPRRDGVLEPQEGNDSMDKTYSICD